MTERELEEILAKGEGIKVEFKEAKENLPKSLFESICAFLNTDGGKILLGVGDDGTVFGIDPDRVQKLKIDLANLTNNPQKLDPVFMLSAREVHYRGKVILVIDVPVSSLVHQCGDTVYARNEEGDYKVTRPEAIAAIVNRKQSYFTEQRIYPYLTLEDFDPRLFDRAKRLIQGRSPGHPWVELTAEELLHRAGFYRKTPEGSYGYTLAAALFFGTDETIQSIVPAYKFDALVRRRDLDRYDDRLTVRTNLIDAYDLLMGFIAKHLDDPFYLEGDVRISLRDKIFRELVSNIIAHREYLDGRPAMMIIYQDRVVFSNPNNPREKGIIDPSRFTPFPKNPTISKFMMQLGRVEEVGSGIRNVTKYLPLYAAGGKSEFIEDELFVTNVKFGVHGNHATIQATMQATMQATTQAKALVINCSGDMTVKQLMRSLDLKNREHFRKTFLKPAIEEGLIEMTIPEHPNHPNQKYRLTAKGKTLRKIIKNQ